MNDYLFYPPPCKKNSSLKYRFSDIFPWLCLLVAFLFATLFHARYANELLDSDMAAEMMLAKELNDSGSFLFAENWFYSTEIRVLYQHIPFRLGLLLFPNNWMFARILGQSIMLVLQAASFIFFMSALDHRKAGIYGAAALMCPFGFWYTYYGIYSGMYLTHMILYSVSMGLMIKLAKAQGSVLQMCVWAISLAVLCFLQGMGGIRMLMNLYVPLCIVVLILWVLHCNHPPLAKPIWSIFQFRSLVVAFSATLVCGFGYLINSGYLSKVYSFAQYDEIGWVDFQLSELLSQWSAYLRIFGYPYEGYNEWVSLVPYKNTPLMSLYGIMGATSFVLIVAVLISLFRLFKLWDKLSPVNQLVFTLLPICLLVDGIAYSSLSLATVGSYWLPLVPLTFAVVILWISNEDFLRQRLYQRGVGIILACCIVCTSIASANKFIQFPPRAAINIIPVAKWLEDNGYDQGYASFWFSNVLTEHSNGKIEAWTIVDHANPPIDKNIHPWLQKKNHTTESPDRKCFVLLFCSEFGNPDNLAYNISEDTIVYQDESYTVLGYDSVDDILKSE